MHHFIHDCKTISTLLGLNPPDILMRKNMKIDTSNKLEHAVLRQFGSQVQGLQESWLIITGGEDQDYLIASEDVCTRHIVPIYFLVRLQGFSKCLFNPVKGLRTRPISSLLTISKTFHYFQAWQNGICCIFDPPVVRLHVDHPQKPGQN